MVLAGPYPENSCSFLTLVGEKEIEAGEPECM